MAAPGPIVHVATARAWRGGEQQLLDLAVRLDAAGVPQRLLCAAGSALARAAAERGLEVVQLRRRLGADPRFAWVLARAARGASLVHVHDAHSHAAAVVAAAAFRLAAPVVVHRRVDFRVGRGPLSRWKYAHRSVRRIVCVSHAVAEVIRHSVPDRGRVTVVHDGLDRARFDRARPDGRLRAALGIPRSVPLVGNVAALVGHKDHATFLATAARLVSSGLDARFVLVGDGPLRRALEARVHAAGLERHVAFLGFRADVAAILPELDVFLFTSSEEGLGSSILDAWACQVPVVATAAGGIPELIEDGRTGLLAPVRDPEALAAHVGRVLADGALRERLAAGGAARLAEFGADRMAERVLAIYREVAAEVRAAGAATDSATCALGSFLAKSRFQR